MNGSPLPLPPVLSSRLSDFRRRVWAVKLTEGLLASLCGLAVSYLAVLALDRFMETPVWLRSVLLILGATVPGIGLPLQWHRWVWRQRRLEDAARLLRWRFPRLGDQLLGIVELARQSGTGAATGRSERLVQAAMAQADEAVRDQDFSGAVPRARHRQWAWATAAAALLVAAGFVTINEAARNALARWLMPWRETERFTFARIGDVPNPLVVPLAEPFTLPVNLTAGSRWRPESAAAELAGQPAVSAPLDGGAYQLPFSPQKRDGDILVRVGDVRRTVRLEPRPRPELTGLQVRLRLPDYLQYETRPVVDARGGSVTVLKGSQVSFEAGASRELARAEVDGQPVRTEQGRLITEPQAVEEARDVTFTWWDSLGLTARVPLVLQLRTSEDEAPRITASRESLEQVVLDSEVVAFDISASDDFGLRHLGLEWKSVPDSGQPEGATPVKGGKIIAAGAPETKQLKSRATFCATREGLAPGTYEVRAWAADYLDSREPTRGAAFTLHVLNRTDHALWVTQQMGKWLEAARETYEREQQLHQTNKELRALAADELDRPENRRRVALQSSAENANAARLAALNQAGRSLVEHASKNSEFDAPRLESWATMLKSLQDIAANRMPDVAGLLKQAADAKADGKPASAGGPPGSPPNPSLASTPAGSGGKPASPSQDNPAAPSIVQGAPPPAGGNGAPPADPEAKPKEGAPSIKLTESTMNPPAPPAAPAPEAPPKPPGAGKLTLPTNSLAAAPGQKPGDPPPAESSAQKPLEAGVNGQRELLAEFAKVSDQLTEILASLEASTFVKRLKAASREQAMLASGINQKTLDAFGVGAERLLPPPAGQVGAKDPEAVYTTAFAPEAEGKAREQSRVVEVIQSDLEAYFQRRPEGYFRKVLSEMKQIKVVRELERVGDRAANNLSGNAIHGAEFWADTLDRWAEEMVAASKCSNCSSCSGDSLPPEIVLKVMQALRDEMRLRDETRELEQAKKAIQKEEHRDCGHKLAEEQTRISTHTKSAMEDITALPEGAQKFAKEMKLLTAVVGVMEETVTLLRTPETGAPAIAAETEAIELLLQTKRQKPDGGGGGGSSPGGGRGGPAMGTAALADLGPGSDADTVVSARPVGQATGRAGREFPEEFRSGLDAYFSHLEGTRRTP